MSPPAGIAVGARREFFMRDDGAPEGREADHRGASQAPSGADDFRALVDDLPDAVVLYDGQKRRVYSNRVHRRYMDLAGAPWRGKTVLESSIFSPADAQAYDRLLNRVLTAGERINFEVRLRGVAGTDGEPVDMSINLGPLRDDQGRICGVQSVSRDVSALKRAVAHAERSAQEFQTLLELIPDTVIRYDRDLRRAYCNPAAVENLSASAARLGWRSDRRGSLPDPAEYMRRLQRCIDDKCAGEYESSWVDRQGETRQVHILLKPELDDAGEVSGVLAIGRDVTDLVAIAVVDALEIVEVKQNAAQRSILVALDM